MNGQSILACLPGISFQIGCAIDSRRTESDYNGNLRLLYAFSMTGWARFAFVASSGLLMAPT
jgi:hypothetical protein